MREPGNHDNGASDVWALTACWTLNEFDLLNKKIKKNPLRIKSWGRPINFRLKIKRSDTVFFAVHIILKWENLYYNNKFFSLFIHDHRDLRGLDEESLSTSPTPRNPDDGQPRWRNDETSVLQLTITAGRQNDPVSSAAYYHRWSRSYQDKYLFFLFLF